MHDEDGHVEMVTDRVDGGPEDQILQSAVPVGAHNHQVRANLAGVAHNFTARGGRMEHDRFDCETLLAERTGDGPKVLLAGLDLRRGRVLPVYLAGDALFDVNQV